MTGLRTRRSYINDLKSSLGALSKRQQFSIGLREFHVMPFTGYMPLSYGSVGAVVESHKLQLRRTSAGLFDVSHMVQTSFRGGSTTAFLQHHPRRPSALTQPIRLDALHSVKTSAGASSNNTVVLAKQANDAYYVVINSVRQERDLACFKEQLDDWNTGDAARESGKVEMEIHEGWNLLALQDLTCLVLRRLTFGYSTFMPIEGCNLHVVLGGYRSEDGFEISVPPAAAVALAQLLAKAPMGIRRSRPGSFNVGALPRPSTARILQLA